MPELEFDIDWSLINQSAADWASEYVYDLVSMINDTSRDALQRLIPQYFEEQMTQGELADALLEVFSPGRVNRIARTEVTRAASEGEQAVARQLEAQGIKMRPIWQTRHDEIVCDQGCLERHDRPITDDIFPPLHPNCRCWVVYEYVEEEEILEEEPIRMQDRERVREFSELAERDLDAYDEKGIKWQKSLKEDEKYVMKEWSISAYRDIRQSYMIGEDFRYKDAFESALNSAPKVSDTVWRGITYRQMEPDDILNMWERNVGTRIKWEPPSSTTLNPEVAASFSNRRTGVIFEMNDTPKYTNSSNVFFQRPRDEFEAILMPGTEFDVIDVFMAKYKTESGIIERLTVLLDEFTG